MEKHHAIFISIHIAAGALSLLFAPLAMITAKGGKAHRLWGKIYFWCMAVVAVTAVLMSVYHEMPFFLFIAVFSFYSAIAGYRVLYRKKLASVSDVAALDWMLSGVNGLFCLGLAVYGILALRQGADTLGIVALVFSVIGLQTTVQEFLSFFRPPRDPKHWLRAHIGGMVGSYIAAVTAFLVNTGFFLPELARWLGPTVIGVPLIVWWQKKYAAKKRAA